MFGEVVAKIDGSSNSLPPEMGQDRAKIPILFYESLGNSFGLLLRDLCRKNGPSVCLGDVLEDAGSRIVFSGYLAPFCDIRAPRWRRRARILGGPTGPLGQGTSKEASCFSTT